MRRGIFAFVLAMLMPAAALAATDRAKPLFAGDDVIRVTIKGPVAAVARTGGTPSAPRPASLSVAGAHPETLAISLSPRGLTRRKPGVCSFSPLRVEFTDKPPQESLFSGQKKLKLVTHCQGSAGYQQYVLLEYAAYRLYNAITPLSLRVRLATIDYAAEDGRVLTTRLGFFIEDTDDAARRNGMREAKVGDSVGLGQLGARDAARFALFEYMISNLDWSMRGGPAGEGCCHNAKLIAVQGAATGLIPIPYDFDFSGLVDPPSAVPPDGFAEQSVRERRYRGYCVHNAAAQAAATEFIARQGALKAVLNGIPQLDAHYRGKASAFLDSFFAQIASDKGLGKMFKTCVG